MIDIFKLIRLLLTIQKAVAVVEDIPLRSDSSMVVLDVDLPSDPALAHLQKQYYPAEQSTST